MPGSTHLGLVVRTKDIWVTSTLCTNGRDQAGCAIVEWLERRRLIRRCDEEEDIGLVAFERGGQVASCAFVTLGDFKLLLMYVQRDDAPCNDAWAERCYCG